MTTSNNWSEDEVTLALVLYLSRPFGKLRSTNPDVEHLAALLGRTPGAVSRKLGNLGFCDNTLRERGIKGLSNVSKVDVLTWEKYVGSERGKKPLGPLLADASMIAADRNIDIDFLFDETTTKKEMPLASGRLVLRKECRSQQFFREVILAGYGGRCAISGLRVPELTEAAHIIPWAEREDCRLLPSNGIALNTLLHRAYDADLLGIDENCRVYVSKPLLKGAKDSKLQAFFESVDGAILQSSRHFTPSAVLLEERFARFLESLTYADASLFDVRKRAETYYSSQKYERTDIASLT